MKVRILKSERYIQLARLSVLVAAIFFLVSCHRHTFINSSCDVDGPYRLMPAQLKRVHLGISFKQLIEILGEPDYSPDVFSDYTTAP